MTPRTRYRRLLGAATVTTVAVTGLGVVLGPASPGSASASPPASTAPSPVASLLEAVVADQSVPLPEVAERHHADFVAGDGLPAGSRVFNSGANRSGMAMSDGRLVHGAPEGPAAGFVETKLEGDVRLLGARVLFPLASSGSVALVGWQSSLVAAQRSFGPTPSTGLRLVAGPGWWELSVVDDGDVHVLGGGSYAVATGAATFEVRRDGKKVYVVDPEGTATVVTDKRAAKLAGPWASWGLTETGPDQSPALIEAVWAG